MGSGLPMAIGACYATSNPVVVFDGDGSFQMNLQELQTVVRNKLPIKIVILNNGCLVNPTSSHNSLQYECNPNIPHNPTMSP
jgi:thiamine pyrophosphate-dependent acetolactate synthase large subunit-like protein